MKGGGGGWVGLDTCEGALVGPWNDPANKKRQKPRLEGVNQ